MLTERLKEEMEEKSMVPQSQTGFRKGMEVIDNIYVLNFLVNRQLKRKGEMVVATFVDLKAVFDSVDRKVLLEAMKERGVREGLRSRIEEIYKETRSRVKVGGKIGEKLLDGKRSEAGMSNESIFIQSSFGGCGGDVEKGRMGRSETRRGKSLLFGICGCCCQKMRKGWHTC